MTTTFTPIPLKTTPPDDLVARINSLINSVNAQVASIGVLLDTVSAGATLTSQISALGAGVTPSGPEKVPVLQGTQAVDLTIDQLTTRSAVGTTLTGVGITLAAGGSLSGPGGALSISAGYATSGVGGDLTLHAGRGLTKGHMIVTNLPTANPSVTGALWTTLGAVMIS